MGAAGRVGKEGAAEALPPALPPVAVDGRLQLVGVAQPTLLTLVGVQVFHVPAAGQDTGGDGEGDAVAGQPFLCATSLLPPHCSHTGLC